MHPRIREVLDSLNERHAELQLALQDVPRALRNRRPEPGRWSAAEVVEHVALVEEQILQLLLRLLREVQATGLGSEGESSSIMQTVDFSLLLDRSLPRVASAAVQPLSCLGADAAWTRLERARAATRQTLLDVDGLALSEVVAPNPVLGDLNLYQWMLFIAGHEGRHAAQIRELVAAQRNVSA